MKYTTAIAIVVCSCLLMVSGMSFAEETAKTPDQAKAAAPAETATAAPAAAPEEKKPETMQEKMGNLLSKMVAAAKRVKDYTATFTKQEIVDGKQWPLETVFMKAKAKPHCVYLKWIKEPNKGRESLYCQGKYDNEIQAHEGSGFSSIFGTVSLDPTGSMAMKGNRHPITDAGIHHTVKLIQDDFALAQKHPEHGVIYTNFLEAKVNGQPSYCVLALQPEDKKLGYYAYKAEICIHKKLYLPTSVKIWDHKDKLVEQYTYSNYKINPGLTDADFDKKNKDYDF